MLAPRRERASITCMTFLLIPQAGGYLRSLFLEIRTSGGPPRYDRPHHAADRTRSRCARAGSRRVKRHGLNRPGPRGWSRVKHYPWNPIEINEIRTKR
jgi:hypothetical protein